MSLEFHHVTHRFGREQVLRGVSLAAEPGAVTCLLGASGSGKSTLLRLAAGLLHLQAGEIRLDGAVLCTPGDQPPPEQRPVGLVFQEHVLFPHKTVLDNVAFGLRGLDPQRRRAAAQASLAGVGLDAFAERYPDTLSGGQQQRVALARSLAPAPRVVLLDEPFASVDATLRRALREDARHALRQSGSIAVIVTHDPEEALELADRIAVMERGRIVQVDTPAEIWRRPAERAVAALFGEAQHLPGTVSAGSVTSPFGRLPVACADAAAGVQTVACADAAAGDEVDVFVRPTAVSLSPAAGDADGTGTVDDVRFLSDGYRVLVAAGGRILRARVADLNGISVGDRVAARFDSAGVFAYAKDADEPLGD